MEDATPTTHVNDAAGVPRRGALTLLAALVGGMLGTTRGETVAARRKGKVTAAKKKKAKAIAGPAGPVGPQGQAGAAGAAGPPGVTTFTYRNSAAEPIGQNGYKLMTALCEPGEKAIAGGGGAFTDARAAMISSYGNGALDRWTAEFKRVDNSGASDPLVMATVICVK